MKVTDRTYSNVLLIILMMASVVSTASCHAETDQTSQRKVITSGTGLIAVEPNMAQLNMQLEALNRDGSAAKADVDQRVNDFLVALKALNIDDSDLVASSLQLQPNYEYHNNKREFSGYRASRNIALTVNRLEQLNQLMDLALESGIDQIGQIELKVADERRYRQQAQQQAIADSLQKASVLAKAYGATLGPVLQIEYRGSAVHYPQPHFDMQAMRRSAQLEKAPQGKYRHDNIQFNDHINVIFELLVKD